MPRTLPMLIRLEPPIYSSYKLFIICLATMTVAEQRCTCLHLAIVRLAVFNSLSAFGRMRLCIQVLFLTKEAEGPCDGGVSEKLASLFGRR